MLFDIVRWNRFFFGRLAEEQLPSSSSAPIIVPGVTDAAAIPVGFPPPVAAPAVLPVVNVVLEEGFELIEYSRMQNPTRKELAWLATLNYIPS